MPEFEFRDAGQVKQWAPTHDLAGLEGTAEGMLLRISGGDPYTLGPARDYPEGVALRRDGAAPRDRQRYVGSILLQARAEPGAIGCGRN